MNKESLKCLVRWTANVVVAPLFLVYRLLILVSGKDQIFSTYAQFLSLIPGLAGSYLRNSFYRWTMDKCDYGVVFSFGSLFSHVNTTIENGVYIGPNCNIGSCHIQKNCLLGSGVHIISGKKQHDFSDLEAPLREQGGTFEKISIGEDTWIGNGAIVMANVGKKCVIAAGSVVVNSVEDFSIVGGNPATLLKKR